MNEYLVIDGIELGQNDTIDTLRVFRIGVISKSLIKFHQLIDGFVTHQRFTNEQDQIGLIYLDQL